MFSGFTLDLDPATGRDIRRDVISIRATRAEFDRIDLARIDPAACARNFALGVRNQVAVTGRTAASRP